MRKKFFIFIWLKKIAEVFNKAGDRAAENELKLEDKDGKPYEIKNKYRFL